MGISLFKDWVIGVAGTIVGIAGVTAVDGADGMEEVIEVEDDAGSVVVSAITFSTTPSLGDIVTSGSCSSISSCTLLVSSSIAVVASSCMVGSDDDLGNGPEAMRSLSFAGDRDGDLLRFGDGGGFLKSMRGQSSVEQKRGTDCALPFFGELAGEKYLVGGPSLAVDNGFLLVVADRLRADRRPASRLGSE